MENPFELSAIFRASPDEVYEAWLTSASHSKMTGGEAICSKEVGGAFSAWDGYISGQNIKLVPGKEIIQAWRTTEFAKTDIDSTIEIQLTAVEKGTKLSINHSKIPDGHLGYKQGWQDHYFSPMRAFFNDK